MGICCVGRNLNEALFDDFFYNMKIVEENTLDMYEMIDIKIDNQGQFYDGRVLSFINNFFEDHIKNGKSEKWTNEARKYFEYEFNSNAHGFFNFTAFLILLSKSDKINQKMYAKYIFKLAQRFNLVTKEDCQILRKSFESFLLSYIKFVSSDAIAFVKNLSSKPEELVFNFNKNFSEEGIQALQQQFLKGFENTEFIDINEFVDKHFFSLHHSEIRMRLIEMH